MRSGLRLVLVTALTLVAGAGAARMRGVLAGLDLFRVRHVSVEGALYLSEEEALASAAVPAGASVWDDTAPWEARLEAHPLVKDARVRRRLPSTLVLDVEERVPIAFLPTPTLAPVDGRGRLLPIDPALHRLDLPVVLPLQVEARFSRGADSGGRATPAGVNRLARELARLSTQEPGFVRDVAVLSAEPNGAMAALWGGRGVRLLFRPPLSSRRLGEARAALADARDRFPERTPVTVDLRFIDQVVVGFAGADR